jgi:hypothetical protein
MKLMLGAAIIGGMISCAAMAQETPQAAAVVATPSPVMPASGQAVLPANTEILSRSIPR